MTPTAAMTTFRSRPRTFPYTSLLPYETETEEERLDHLNHIIANLYIAIKGDDLKGIIGNSTGPAVYHWTKELRSWIGLKFDMPLKTRIKLIKLYYSLALAGTDGAAMEKFINMFCLLCKDDLFQDTIKPQDLDLDWKTLVIVMRKLAFPQQSSYDGSISKSFSALSRLAQVARHLITPEVSLEILEEILPHYTTAKASVSHNVMSLLILLLPAVPSEGEEQKIMPKYLLPSVFHLWSLMPRSSLYDFQALDLVATLVSDSISSELVMFDKYGILSQDQLSIVFTAILRLLEVPVSYVGSPYVQSNETVSLKSDRERKIRCARPIANIIVYSLSAESGLENDGILDRLEGLIHGVETFCHPSNQGNWTRNIMQTIALMVEIFLLRWNVQISDESVIPKERHLTERVKDRFVEILRNVTFLGIHAKSSTVVSSSLEALQGLAYLSPDLIIPRLLKEVYPSLQGLVETHRTMSSLKALTVLARKISQEPKYALHITTLLGLAVPGIDANDLSKTLNSLSFIQAVALNVPFHDISGDLGSGLAMEYISSSIAYLEENGEFPQIPQEILPDIVKSSTIAFDEFVILLLDRVFAMLENLPDSSNSKSRDSPEAHVVNALPPAITAILGSVSPTLFNRIVNHVVDFVSNNVIHNATDPIAHICGCLVKVNSKVAFPKLFQMLYYKIKEEIEENGAGSIRSGSEILPRDRALIWYLSCLNMALAHSFNDSLPFKEQIIEITLFLRKNCKGSIVYHVSNTIHHTLMTLTTTIANDYNLVGNDKVGLNNWGEKTNANDLQLKWHIPSREEIEFAVELYWKHCEISINSIKEVVDNEDKKFSVTEISDIISNNMTYIRTSTSGISLLFDTKYSDKMNTFLSESIGDSEYEESESQEIESDDSDYSTDEDELLQDNLIAADDDLDIEGEFTDLKKYREYPVNYFFNNKTKLDDPLYHKIHELRITIGKFLHEVHLFLSKSRDNDISSFKALLFAIKVWFSDVGIERSAKTADSLVALYSYETKHFRIAGLRKEYPRPVLARRAYLYHYERLTHNIGPRKMTELEKLLLFDSVKSCLSIYPDIRRNGQSSFESAIKTLISARSHVYPYVLRELNLALQAQEYNKAESAVRLLNMRIMQSSIKRDFKHIISLVDYIKQAMQADYPNLNAIATSLYNYFATNIRLPLNIVSINMKVIEEIGELVNDSLGRSLDGKSINTKIALLISKKKEKRAHAEKELSNLIDHLANDNEDNTLHWKLIAVNSGLFTAICSSPQMPINSKVLIQLGNGALSPHPGIKAICMHGLFMISSKLFNLANSGYDYNRFLLDCDEDNIISDNGIIIDSSIDNFQDSFLKELESFNNPTYYLDKGNADYGWLVWPKKFEADRAEYKDTLKFNEQDEIAVRNFGSMMTEEWISGVISRHLEEPRTEDDYFDVTNAIFFKIVLRLIGMGFTPITIDSFLSLVEKAYDPSDKNSHRCMTEMCSAIIDSLKFTEGNDVIDKKVTLLVKIFSDILNNNISHDNIDYWRSFVWWSSIYIDFRRAWQVEKLINEIRLQTNSPTGVKDSSRLSLLRKSIGSIGWYYKHNVDDIIDNLWDNITHPLQGVRDEVAKTLAIIYSSRYHESFPNVETFIKENFNSGPVGLLCYKMDNSLSIRIENAFNKLEIWRLERGIDGRGTSQYVLAAKTLSLFLETLFQKSYAVSLVPLFPKTILPALLNFLNVRDEEEVMLSAVSLFKLLGNIPCPMQYIQLMVDMIVDIGTKATTWHQRISILSYIQAFFFRQLFKMNENHRTVLINSVTDMLQDVQLEVRELAAETLAGLLRCSPITEQEKLISKLQQQCTQLLHETRNWKSIKRNPISAIASPIPSRPGTPLSRTGVPLNEYQFSMVKRHSAVLGLGALVKAFPYQSPPPHWIPQVMQVLAIKAANDPGMVGKSVKATLGDFKKTRQDTWHIDSKIFTPEQLEDLEGVLWKNYFI